MQYEVIYEGKPTGIIVNEKKVSFSVLVGKVPSAKPFGKIEFKEHKKKDELRK